MARRISKIIVHCSASPDTLDVGFKQINEWHKARFAGVEVDGVTIYCGYHAIVRQDGTVELGRPEQEIGAHAHGHNANSLGICWVGSTDIGQMQRMALVTMIRMWLLKYGLGARDVIGHHEVNPSKSCPNLNMEKMRDELEIQLGSLM